MTPTSLLRLRLGMTEAEVEAVLGPPTGERPPPEIGGRVLEYSGSRATATVLYNPEGRLVEVGPSIHEMSRLERLRDRLGW